MQSAGRRADTAQIWVLRETVRIDKSLVSPVLLTIFVAIAFQAASQLQLMLTLAFPDGAVKWGATSFSSQ